MSAIEKLHTLHVVWGHASLIKTKEQAGLGYGTPADGGTSPGPHNIVTGTRSRTRGETDCDSLRLRYNTTVGQGCLYSSRGIG
jgi:hypothetical protein